MAARLFAVEALGTLTMARALAEEKAPAVVIAAVTPTLSNDIHWLTGDDRCRLECNRPRQGREAGKHADAVCKRPLLKTETQTCLRGLVSGREAVPDEVVILLHKKSGLLSQPGAGRQNV
jgi:hypothetical protein